ncbi:MAG TPA: hypothetical protein VG520_00565 [Candidatus Dormibacteraeota bacterium]|nr:hypothetical protein [Candidatus Dormibacteraeota bacterium]
MLSTSPPLTAATVRVLTPRWTSDTSLRGRRQRFWRRRLVLRMRDWMGIGAIVAVSLTLFAVTFFSLIAR